MMNQNTNRDAFSSSKQLTHALTQLPTVDLDPFATRALRTRAHQRLTATRAARWWFRIEATTLVALSAAHLGWALFNVVGFRP